jgi:hypothetical protein
MGPGGPAVPVPTILLINKSWSGTYGIIGKNGGGGIGIIVC